MADSPADIEAELEALRKRLAKSEMYLEAARCEVRFLSRMWRDCALGCGGDDGLRHGFRDLACPTPLVCIDRPLHWKRQRPWKMGMTGEQAFNLEVGCLTRLQALGGASARHFPAIACLQPATREFAALSVGRSLDAIRREGGGPPPPEGAIEAQADSIVAALARAGVIHLDIHPGGKNLCIDTEGTLALIDFDIAMLDGVPFSGEVERRHADWQRCGGYAHSRAEIVAIAKACLCG